MTRLAFLALVPLLLQASALEVRENFTKAPKPTFTATDVANFTISSRPFSLCPNGTVTSTLIFPTSTTVGNETFSSDFANGTASGDVGESSGSDSIAIETDSASGSLERRFNKPTLTTFAGPIASSNATFPDGTASFECPPLETVYVNTSSPDSSSVIGSDVPSGTFNGSEDIEATGLSQTLPGGSMSVSAQIWSGASVLAAAVAVVQTFI
ncbi:hypothetical protein FA15DRAFT_670744 [Coprinopsis marcescibilis]|uniref:GPI anchored cell wall protein n=1 Tax=Coprinopsis marcescibilis TaxID=230819 RepID=A0A5C3KRA9_COPMA|nr:hypothetical protein FA15DRAFT_670744 [Coprinopsis marcescibilis]